MLLGRKGQTIFSISKEVIILILVAALLVVLVLKLTGVFKNTSCDTYCSFKSKCDSWKDWTPVVGDFTGCVKNKVIDSFMGNINCNCCENDDDCERICLNDRTLQTGYCYSGYCDKKSCFTGGDERICSSGECRTVEG